MVLRRTGRWLPLGWLLALLPLAAAGAPGPASPRVAVMVTGHGVDPATRQITGPADTFCAAVGRVYCLTRVVGAADSTSVTHVWYHEGRTLARVELPVRSADWRTWSSKRILPAWTGNWEVAVLDAAGVVLARHAFRIAPPRTAGAGPAEGRHP